MTLRGEIKNDSFAREWPTRFLEHVEKFTAEDWERLLTALKAGDKVTAAKMFGMTPDQAADTFKQIKEASKKVIAAHPEILDLTKGRS